MNDLERALASLVPDTGGFNRDVLLFRAGMRSAGRGPGWPLLGVSMTLTSVVLAVALVFRAEPEPVMRTVEVPVPAVPAAPKGVLEEPRDAAVAPSHVGDVTPVLAPVAAPAREQPPDEHSLWRLQQHVLRWGVEELPESDTSWAAPTPSPGLPWRGTALARDAILFNLGEP